MRLAAALAAARLGLGGCALFGFLQPVAVGLDREDLGAMEEAIDEGHDAGGIGEDLRPLLNGLFVLSTMERGAS